MINIISLNEAIVRLGNEPWRVFVLVVGIVFIIYWKTRKKDDVEEPKAEQTKMEEEDYEEGHKCERCGKEFDSEECFQCNVCKVFVCDKCSIYYEHEIEDESYVGQILLCKKCIDKVYPREEKVKEVIKYVTKETKDSKIGKDYFD